MPDKFLRLFIAVLLDCLKQAYQIFRAAIFNDVSEDLIFSFDLNISFHYSLYGI